MKESYFKSLKFKLISLVVMGIVPLTLCIFFYVFPVFETYLIDQRKDEVKTAVDLAIGMLDKIQSDVDSGRLEKKNFDSEVQAVFNKLRYNETDYFFAYDSKGFSTAHGLKAEFVGTDRIDSRDPEGVFYVREFLKFVDKKEGGFVSYKFEKALGEQPLDKVSYIKYYPQKGWVVGSGVYLDDVQKQISAIRTKVIIGLLVVTLVTFLISWNLSTQLCRRIFRISNDLNMEADKVAEVANNVSQASDGLSASTTEQASALQQTSTSIEETSAMISKNAENAKTSMSITARSQNSVDQGKKIVNEMITSIQEIAQSNHEMVRQIEESNEEIGQIVKVINEIGEKTKVINDIVFQTKLLSFNASVEAARAGEQGKGFAVVAEEVGNLARMSGNSAKEISDLLATSIQSVKSTIDNSKNRISKIVVNGEIKVKHGAEIAQRCGEILDEIVSNVNQVNGMMCEISTASHEQATGVKEINSAVSELDLTGQHNSMLAQKTAVYAEQLLVQVRLLKKNTGVLNVIVTGEDAVNRDASRHTRDSHVDVMSDEKKVKKAA